MTVSCPCGAKVTIELAPTYSEEAWVECRSCGLRYDATPGRAGQPLPVCEGFEIPQ